MSTQTNWLNATSLWGQAVAEHPDTSSDALTVLACHRNIEVRTAVADHKNTTNETVMLLAQDESVDLRYAIAENHNVGENVLNMLIDDANPFVAHRAKKTLARIRGASILALPIAKVPILRLQMRL